MTTPSWEKIVMDMCKANSFSTSQTDNVFSNFRMALASERAELVGRIEKLRDHAQKMEISSNSMPLRGALIAYNDVLALLVPESKET